MRGADRRITFPFGSPPKPPGRVVPDEDQEQNAPRADLIVCDRRKILVLFVPYRLTEAITAPPSGPAIPLSLFISGEAAGAPIF